MTFLEQIFAQLGVVINLAIEKNLNAVVFVSDRLVAAGNIDDAQPSMTEPDAGTHVNRPVLDG